MPKDSFSIRTPSYRAKLAQIRGVSPDEKALLQRIGGLIDVLSFDQRQSSNPRLRRRIPSDEVPVPQNVQVTTITGGITVTWDPVAIGELEFYEIEVAESTTFVDPAVFQVINNSLTYRATPADGVLFIRLRAVTKRGFASEYTATLSVTVQGSTIFATDQDHIEPENRTTVTPRPTLQGTLLTSELGNKAFVGVGAYCGGSPITFSDNHEGYKANPNIRNEVTYTVYDEPDPYPGLQQLLAPTVGEYIDADGYYIYTPQFYTRFTTLPNSFADFYDLITLPTDGSTLDVEFLRYRILNAFYKPFFNQAGYVLSATLSTIRF